MAPAEELLGDSLSQSCSDADAASSGAAAPAADDSGAPATSGAGAAAAAASPRPAAVSAELALGALVTVIVTTSAAPVHPSTELLDQVLGSLVTNAPELADSRVIVVCDGCKMSAKNAWRSGRVTEDGRDAYDVYKARLRAAFEASPAPAHLPRRCELLELPTNHGFGFAVRAALEHVDTPLVCVVQHDRAFLRRISLRDVVATMLEQQGRVGYVLLPTKSTSNYAAKQSCKLAREGAPVGHRDIERLALALPTPGQRLLPCLSWFDSTHLCLTSYYRDFIFARSEWLVRRGGFIEGELVQLQFPEFVKRGLDAALGRWRTYLYDDGSPDPVIGHLNGSNYESWDVLNEKYGAFNKGRVGRKFDISACGREDNLDGVEK
eukprot:TRINITY_DN6812_c2_g3_i2.p1 TRINITY_DN6812_c2_g3~~TRINITY_DN6812_c2_g3_i2.p1  ORF type:complete len:379 (-),score=81.70 TRINITY_DN6812_c2_g3_i2:171-1307(-)